MSRTRTLTLTATAVTLACVGASLAVSPQVVAQSMGRDIAAFAPLDPSTYPGADTPALEQTLEATAMPRDVSTLRIETAPPADEPDRTRHTPIEPPTDQATQRTFHIAGSPIVPQRGVTSASTEELSQVKVELPQTPEAPDVDSPEALTVIVNKLRPLPADYVPEDLVELPADFGSQQLRLRQEAADATEALVAAAAQDGLDLTVLSAYRAYDYQRELYDTYVHDHGADYAEAISAKPGHSEHQTGLAIDLDATGGTDTLTRAFGQTAAGQWLAEHAPEFGFVIRYPDEARDITGFHYEPWHLRYFGEQYATQIAENSGIAETEFGLEPAPDYRR